MLSPCLFQRIMELDAARVHHKYIYVDEVVFKLNKTRHGGRNVIGQCAIIHVPGQQGGNIAMCAAMGQNGVLHHHAILGPYNTDHIITFLKTQHNILIPDDNHNGSQQSRFVINWYNVNFHWSARVRNWFINHPQMSVLYLPP